MIAIREGTMAKKHKAIAIRPDEAFTHGPLSVARFGRNVVWRSKWLPGEFDRMRARLVERLPAVIQEIETLVAAIADQVRVLPPDKILHRAWWEMVTRHMNIASEADVDTDDAVSMRMIDYIQSVIASVPPVARQMDDIADEDWQTLSGRVGELFRKLNVEYQLCNMAVNRVREPDISAEVEEFQYKAQLYWCNVRGNRYQVHELAYLRDVFLPHSAVLFDLFGISGEQFVTEIAKIWHSLTFGLGEAFESMERLRNDVMAALEARMSGADDSDERELMSVIVKEKGWETRAATVSDLFIGLDLFDVQKAASLPKSLLDELTWSPGEDATFFANGPFRGWPLRIWPIIKRPFIRLDERFYCFHLHSLLDNLYRVMERIICRLKPDYREPWNHIQQELSEDLPFKYLQQILPGAYILQSIHYQWISEDSGRKEWYEADGILAYDDHLFIVEARGGAFTYTPPATDFPAYVASLRNLLLKPATQGKRFLEYLESRDAVSVFGRDHKPLGELRRADFRHVTICPVTLDPLTELAAQVQHLHKLGVDVGTRTVWAISLDDLRVFADIFSNPLLFLHFVEERTRAFHSNIIQSDDELDHVGLYLKHNDYSMHAAKLKADTEARITFHGYRSEIDAFFAARLHDPQAPCRLAQEIPPRLLDVIQFLAVGRTKGCSRLASFLLDIAGDWRNEFARYIDAELERQPSIKRTRPLSTHGDVRFTMFCWMEPWVARDAKLATDHGYTVMLLGNEPDRVVLELRYNESAALIDVQWEFLALSSLSEMDRSRLRVDAEKLREERVSVAGRAQKLRRNQSCPCGSGQKYKRCCLNRWRVT